MKKVLCFGDSNVFGFMPSCGKRFDKDSRWSGILMRLASEDFKVIEEGCNNRTAFSENPDGENFIGVKILPKILEKQFNFIILAIGINDLQKFYNPSLETFKNGIEKLVDIAKNSQPNAKVILVSPSEITEDILQSYFATMFDEVSIEKSHNLTEIYSDIADEKDCKFIDLNKIAKPSKIDGLHYEKEDHQKIAEAMFQLLKNL